MNEVGIDISRQNSKTLASIPLDAIDQVITLCGDADERCAALDAKIKRSHWPLPDPALAQGDEEKVLQAFRRVRDEIRARVQGFFSATPR
jgi:arsenate reductase